MLFHLGNFLELNGLVLLGFALVWGMVRDDMKGEMAMLSAGVVIFLAGCLLERKPTRRN